MNWLLAVSITIGLSATMALGWFIALRSGKSGWIDAVWSFAVGGFGIIAALAPASGQSLTGRAGLVATLAAIWSLRLGLHIARRTMRGGDDPRYRQLHEEWGEDFRSRLFWFLQVQAVVAMALVLAIAVAAHRPGALQFSDLLGVAIFLAAIFGEATADRQLTKFGKDPVQKGRVCDVGLWGRSRHPNYFFEWCVWLAYIPIAIDWTGAYAWGWFVLIAPMLMYWLLVHVSGIPPLEAHMLRSRGDAFRAYQARVNAFWPGPNPSTKAMTQMDGKLP